jgi:hypothetical protein
MAFTENARMLEQDIVLDRRRSRRQAGWLAGQVRRLSEERGRAPDAVEAVAPRAAPPAGEPPGDDDRLPRTRPRGNGELDMLAATRIERRMRMVLGW